MIAAFVLLIAHPAIEYAIDEAIVRTPGLDISNSWRASAVAACAILIAVFSLLRLATTSPSLKFLAAGAGIAVLACAALWLARPLFLGLGNYNLADLLRSRCRHPGGTGVPIAFAFGIATVGYVALATRAPLTVIVSRMDEGMSHLLLLSIPLFVFLGILIDMTGMARAMVDFSPRCSAMSAAGSPTCCSARCISCPASRAQRPPTWRRLRRCSSPR